MLSLRRPKIKTTNYDILHDTYYYYCYGYE